MCLFNSPSSFLFCKMMLSRPSLGVVFFFYISSFVLCLWFPDYCFVSRVVGFALLCRVSLELLPSVQVYWFSFFYFESLSVFSKVGYCLILTY